MGPFDQRMLSSRSNSIIGRCSYQPHFTEKKLKLRELIWLIQDHTANTLQRVIYMQSPICLTQQKRLMGRPNLWSKGSFALVPLGLAVCLGSSLSSGSPQNCVHSGQMWLFIQPREEASSHSGLWFNGFMVKNMGCRGQAALGSYLISEQCTLRISLKLGRLQFPHLQMEQIAVPPSLGCYQNSVR